MRTTFEVVGHRDDGPILRVAFVGTYPDGSTGNATAKAMQEFSSAVIAEHAPGGVIFDLLDVEYRWGDAICTIAVPLRRTDGSIVPARLVAQGETARALAPLLGPNWLLGAFGVRPCDSVGAAVQELTAGA